MRSRTFGVPQWLLPNDASDGTTIDRRVASYAILLLALATFLAAAAIAMMFPAIYRVDEPAHVGYVASLLNGHLPRIDSPLPSTPLDVLHRLNDIYQRKGTTAHGRNVVYTANHPPFYFLVAAAPAFIGQHLFGLNGAMYGIRLTSALFVALGTIATAALAARLFPGRHRVAVASAALYAATIQIPFLGAYAYSDSSAVLMLTLTLAAAVEVLRRAPGGHSVRFIVWVAVIGTVAAFTRASVLPGVAAIVGAWVVALALAARAGAPRKPAAIGTAVSIAAPALLAGWWYLRNRHLYGSITGDDFLFKRFERVPHPHAKRAFFHPSFWLDVVRGQWGGADSGKLFGITVVGAVGMLVVVAIVLGAASLAQRWKAPDVRTVFAWLAIAATALIVVYGIASFLSRGGFLHQRYFLPLVPIACVLIAAGIGARRWPGWPVTLAAAVLAAFEASAVWRFVEHHHRSLIVSGLGPDNRYIQPTAKAVFGLYVAAWLGALAVVATPTVRALRAARSGAIPGQAARATDHDQDIPDRSGTTHA